MKKHAIWIAGIAAIALSGAAAADKTGTTFVGGQLSQVTYDESGIDSDAKPTMGILRAGHFVTDHFSLEGRAGITLSDDEVHGVDLEVDHLIGVYGAAHMPFGHAPLSGYIIAGA